MTTETTTIPTADDRPHRWSEGAIVYQIYPRSFQDSNGDGVGDLRGIMQRLEYLADLGVNAIWLSPFYPSPMVDFGYDVADYCNVDPLFGTLDDFRDLLTAAHARHIRVLVDLVSNHTSDKHPWFQESRSSRDNQRADWYIWKDPVIDPETGEKRVPNNWREALSGASVWEWDETRQQYYLHSWHIRQPDLNWSNKKVRRAIKEVMRFWLDLGVDGFRLDAVDWLSKDPLFRDDSPNLSYVAGQDSPYDALQHDNSRGWPTEYAYLAEMSRVLDEDKYRDRRGFLVAETYQERHNTADEYVAFYGGLDRELAAPFNFEGLYLTWNANEWRRFLVAFHEGLAAVSDECIATYVLGNHDNPRIVTRLGEAIARSAALMQLTLPGMIVVYYGEEIGMHNVDLPAEVMHDAYYHSRDPERTPMQWSPGRHAGFTDAAQPWLPVASDADTQNVLVQQADKASFLTLYRTLMRLRNGSSALKHGSFTVLDARHADVLAYERIKKDEHYVVLINFSNAPVSCTPGFTLGKLLVSTQPDTQLRDGSSGAVQLLPHEAALFQQ